MNIKTIVALAAAAGLIVGCAGNEEKMAAKPDAKAKPALMTGASPSMLGNACAGCHGPNGVSNGSTPSLQGLPAAYIVSAMNSFKDGSRPSTIMGRIAKGYSESEFQEMGEFFAAGGK